jgi:hypothetical protein
VDSGFKFAMDWDLLVRFREAGAKFVHIAEFLGAFRVHGGQKTSAQMAELGEQEMLRIRQRTLGYIPTRLEIHRALRPFMCRHIATDLSFRGRHRSSKVLNAIGNVIRRAHNF